MSPFEVNTAKDVGFVAASSLAGGRLAGDLKDTPAAYSVQTREFIDALGLENLNEASEWTINSASLVGAGDQEIFGNGFEITSRGVSMSGQQRNFFPLNVSFDSYNLDRYDYSRGPNAVLFGNGSFGGTSNSVTKRALFKKSSTLRLSYGSWDNRRVSYDENLPLNDKLAVRFNLLFADRQGWRDYEAEMKKAVTLAATWKITRNTELLLETEVGEFHRNNPPTFLRDYLSGWDGSTTFASKVTNTTAPSSTIMNNTGVARYGNDTTPYWIFAPDQPFGAVENYANTMRTNGAGSNGTTPPAGGVPIPSGAPNLNLSTRSINEQINAPSWQFDRAIAGSHFRYPSRSFTIATEEPTFKQVYQAHSVFLRHRIGSNLFIEAAGNLSRELRRTQYINARSLNNVYIDINQTLPNGAANPYFLEPYGEGQRSRGVFGNDYASARLATAYTLDTERFGDYVFNLMGGATDQRWVQRIESMRVLRNADPRAWPYNDTVYYRYYWNGSNRTLPEIRDAVYNGAVVPVRWIGDSQRPTDISFTDTQFTYLQGAIKAKYFRDRLHLLAAGRLDTMSVQRTVNRNYGDYPADWNGLDYYYRPAAPADYSSLEDTRPRNADRTPLSSTGRYKDDYNPLDVNLDSSTYTLGAVFHVTRRISVFGNYATSFNPSSSQLRLDGSIMPSPQSKGWDAGLRLHLLDERLNLSFSYYGGSESAQPFEIPFTNNFQDIALANKVGDTSSDGMNVRGMPVVPRQAFDRRDRENSGLEFEATANLTRHWRLSANYALPKAHQTNAWADTRAFIEKWQDVMRQVVIDAGNVFVNGSPVADNSIPADQRPDASAARNGWITIFNNRLPNIVAGKQMLPGRSEALGNLYTDYEFSSGSLKGLRIGGGVNYRGRMVIGFKGGDTIQDPAFPNDPTKAIDDPNADAYTPLYNDAYCLFTASMGYSFKLKRGAKLSLQLRVSNLLDEDTPVYTSSTVQRAPGGDYTKTAARVATPVDFRYQTPRSFSLTATLSY